MNVVIYIRVSSNQQDTRSQESDLTAFATAENGKGNSVQWYREKASGTTYKRSDVWKSLEDDLACGKVQKLVVWRLDRLGRLAGETITLLDRLEKQGIGFYSLKDGFDPSTSAGRLMRNILASVAQFETEVRQSRQQAGIKAAKEAGKSWGGRKQGTRITVTPEVEDAIKAMENQGKSKAEIARLLKVTRQTVYRVLGAWKRKPSMEITPTKESVTEAI